MFLLQIKFCAWHIFAETMLSCLKISNGDKIFQYLSLENIKQEQEFLIPLPNNFELSWINFMQLLRIFNGSVFIYIEISILICFIFLTFYFRNIHALFWTLFLFATNSFQKTRVTFQDNLRPNPVLISNQ